MDVLRDIGGEDDHMRPRPGRAIPPAENEKRIGLIDLLFSYTQTTVSEDFRTSPLACAIRWKSKSVKMLARLRVSCSQSFPQPEEEMLRDEFHCKSRALETTLLLPFRPTAQPSHKSGQARALVVSRLPDQSDLRAP